MIKLCRHGMAVWSKTWVNHITDEPFNVVIGYAKKAGILKVVPCEEMEGHQDP